MAEYTININFPKETTDSKNENVNPLQDPVRNVTVDIDPIDPTKRLFKNKVNKVIISFSEAQRNNILPVTIYFPTNDNRKTISFTSNNGKIKTDDNKVYCCTFKDGESAPEESTGLNIPVIVTYKGRNQMDGRDSNAVIQENI